VAVAAAILPMFAGCGDAGAPSPEPPRTSMASRDSEFRQRLHAEAARHSVNDPAAVHQPPSTVTIDPTMEQEVPHPSPSQPALPPVEAAPPVEGLPPVEDSTNFEESEFEEGGAVEVTPASPSPIQAAAPPANDQAAEAAGSAAQIRLYLARHNIYQPWYPKVGEIEVDPSGVAIVGTSLTADEIGASRKVCAAMLRSGFVAAGEVFYGEDLSHACR
jgi:hypothetical protein